MTAQYAWGLLLLRLVLGLGFTIHGYAKFGSGIENTVIWFDSMGLPGLLAYGVALLEVMGGLALMAGLATRLLAAFYVIVMLVAILKVKLAVGFIGGYELDLAFLAISLTLFLSGGGFYSIDRALFPQGRVKAA